MPFGCSRMGPAMEVQIGAEVENLVAIAEAISVAVRIDRIGAGLVRRREARRIRVDQRGSRDLALTTPGA